MTLSQWFCGRFLGHDWKKEKCLAIMYDQECNQSREVIVVFDVCARCGLESEYFSEEDL